MELVRDAAPGVVIDASHTMYPSTLEVVTGKKRFERKTSTAYGYVLDGSARVVASGIETALEEGGFFAIPGPFQLDAAGRCVVIERHGYLGMHGAGRIEQTGRLSYIDGCSDSLLVFPPRLGDPVLNHLHFPAGIVQTEHTHPSIRLGVVARGTGTAFGGAANAARWEQPLARGVVFLLAAHERHAFRTDEASMDVIAFHPDSDWGPTDAAHPMLNRTYVRHRG